MSQAGSPSRALSGELLRFLIAGGGAVLTDFGVYFALLWLRPDLSPSIAKSGSFVIGAGVSFLLNRQFVFRAEGAASRQIGPFALLYLVTLGLNTAANAVALKFAAPKLLAWLVATGTSTVANYLGMKLVVFRKRHTDVDRR